MRLKSGSKLIIGANRRARFSACGAVMMACALAACTSQPAGDSQRVISGDSTPVAPVTAPPAVQTTVTPTLTSTGAMTPVIYRLQMPFRANSLDSAFWKLVDEDVLDVPTTERLYTNGLRAGRARVADWPEFFKILSDEGAIKIEQGQVLAQSSFGDARLRMSDTMPEELLFIFDEHGLTMRSFVDCHNEFSLGFTWAPRKPRAIRVTICPIVASRYDESIYDLNLTADIGPGEFLVLGTTPETEDPNRVGSRFLTRNGPNQRFEELLLVVGEPVPMVPEHLLKPKPTTQGN